MTARPSVYDLAREADRLYTQADTMAPEDFETALLTFLGDGADKLYRIDALRRKAEADAAYYKDEAKRMEEQGKRAAKLSEHMGGLALELLKARELVGEEPKIAGLVSLVRRDERSVVVLDKKAIPASFFRMVPASEPTKSAILAAIDEGQEVPGVVVKPCIEYPLWARAPKAAE